MVKLDSPSRCKGTTLYHLRSRVKKKTICLAREVALPGRGRSLKFCQTLKIQMQCSWRACTTVHQRGGSAQARDALIKLEGGSITCSGHASPTECPHLS
eukprot:1159813-Pelagomonas_calceolata.AAC.23